ncbi:ClC family H(+)/Cl(-) exchange transporter [Anoxybacterium hadale]|uniref:ClC family H(+)/Cl(-) exchange transporter n=1 Tax=Anoxybacterium hadale TaxID=3408580 RepID=A0ACD1A6N9_9FIRM|nr:ClC family H(+)/Cl(-) exchange transporter [Clostridiales bacterium]
MSKTKIHKLLSGMNELKWSLTVKGLLCGALAGSLSVIYRLAYEYGTESSLKIYGYLRSHPVAILPWLCVAAIIGLLVAWLLKMEPMASGSGIPQVEGVLLYGMKMKWHTILAVRFSGGLLASVLGLSLGREGPSIQIGAAGAQSLAKRISRNKLEENYLITGGAAAGLAAAFNAPISGMLFALEEVHRSFSPLILIAATTSALTADVISKFVFGLEPILRFSVIEQLPVNLYLWLIPVGIVSGLSGVIINRSLLSFQSLYFKLPWYLRPATAFFIALPFGLFLPQVLGGGQNLIKLSENPESGILLVLICLFGKILFTSLSFGSGVPGGIFMPILSIGALTGSCLGLGAVKLGLSPEYIPFFAVCAMAGALSGSVKAPLTGIMLAAEMTGSFGYLLPVAACSFISLLFSDMLKTDPLYESLLERIFSRSNYTNREMEKSALLEVPVELGSLVSGKLISEVEWPKGMLIVGIKRGAKEIIPKGSTKLIPGDYLVVLTSEQSEENQGLTVNQMCRC